jgi:hypothetical protein
MSLPAAQQRILDGIADGLRRGEPKLAAMYAIFTCLCSSEAPPLREQLTGDEGLRRWLAALRSHLHRSKTERGRWLRRRLLIASQVAIALVLLIVLAGLGSPGAVRCGPSSPRHTVKQARLWCGAQALTGDLLGK